MQLQALKSSDCHKRSSIKLKHINSQNTWKEKTIKRLLIGAYFYLMHIVEFLYGAIP